MRKAMKVGRKDWKYSKEFVVLTTAAQQAIPRQRIRKIGRAHV
jgi:uncharacterized protein involved in propanediol utilization